MRKIFLLLFLCGCQANDKVVGITDGDTIKVRHNGTEIKVRLEGIDAPEKKQPYYAVSKQALSDKIYGRQIRLVESKDKDKWERMIADVYIDDRWINKEMVDEGMAWNYAQYSKSSVLADSEKEAKRKKIGIWTENSPTPPWKFRKHWELK